MVAEAVAPPRAVRDAATSSAGAYPVIPTIIAPVPILRRDVAHAAELARRAYVSAAPSATAALAAGVACPTGRAGWAGQTTPIVAAPQGPSERYASIADRATSAILQTTRNFRRARSRVALKTARAAASGEFAARGRIRRPAAQAETFAHSARKGNRV
jgi:hypothetical protein